MAGDGSAFANFQKDPANNRLRCFAHVRVAWQVGAPLNYPPFSYLSLSLFLSFFVCNNRKRQIYIDQRRGKQDPSPKHRTVARPKVVQRPGASAPGMAGGVAAGASMHDYPGASTVPVPTLPTAMPMMPAMHPMQSMPPMPSMQPMSMALRPVPYGAPGMMAPGYAWPAPTAPMTNAMGYMTMPPYG